MPTDHSPDDVAPSKKGQGITYKPTDQDRRTVAMMSSVSANGDGRGGGFTQEQICSVLGINPDTLRKYFRRELDTAHLDAKMRMQQSLFQQGMGRPARSESEDGPAVSEVLPNVAATKSWLEYYGGAVRTERAEVVGDENRPLQVNIKLVG